METRRLGNIEVSPIGMGCMAFSHGYGEMQTLARMDKGQPMIGNPQNPALVEMSAGW